MRNQRKVKAKQPTSSAHTRRPLGRPALSVDRSIAVIPSKGVDELLQMWRNALTIKSNKLRRRDWDAAQRLISAIEVEWKARRLRKFDPDAYFKWPSTHAEGGSGRLMTGGWIGEGLLVVMGYRVGSTHGVATDIRHAILHQIFQGELPPVESPEYMEEWKSPKSAGRLQKIAETIAALTRNAKRRRDARLGDAIRSWEHDLRFMYDKYYVGHFHFAWPDAGIV